MSDIWWEQTKIQFQRVRRVIVLLLALYRIKCMEPLSFDSLAGTDVFRRLSTSAKVFVLCIIWHSMKCSRRSWIKIRRDKATKQCRKTMSVCRSLHDWEAHLIDWVSSARIRELRGVKKWRVMKAFSGGSSNRIIKCLCGVGSVCEVI